MRTVPVRWGERMVKPSVVGFLMAGDRSYPSYRAFHDELAHQGIRAGNDFQIEERFGEGQRDRLPALASELAALGVDLLCVVGAVSVLTAQRHAARVPLLFSVVLDPIAAGLVPSRGGGPVSGATSYEATQPARQVALWKRALPGIERLGIFGDSGVPSGLAEEAEEAARGQGLQPVTVKIGGRDEIAMAVRTLLECGVPAVTVLEVPRTSTFGRELLTELQGAGLPTMFGYDLAWLRPPLAYGTSLADATRVMARQAARFLSGVRLEAIPIETAARMRLRVGLDASNRVGLYLPSDILAEAEV